mmetsp:Transcript_40398/g.84065  ORF Transcript_40398/g.84065 Transcript_40398/m.84065 type:complete len:495 (-) Transcript_40398:246-1730(-)
MTVSKVYYYERASVFDRMLILLLGLACIFLVNMKNNCPPCAEQAKMVEVVQDHYSSSSGSVRSSSGGSGGGGPKSNFQKIKVSSGDDDEEEDEGESSSVSTKKKSGGGNKKFSSSSSGKTSITSSGENLQGTKFIKEGSKWKNKYDVVHIMTTRYMQMQPDLMHLGKARNDLMRVFAMPGIVGQTTQEFIWIIFTDPNLNQELLDEVLEMIKPYPNILLLGMNNGMNNFRTVGWMQNIKKVFSGDLQMLKDYQKASKHRVLLETRLDADDSIFVEMMDSVQKQAADSMGKRAIESQYDPAKLEKEYRIFCTEHHLEWGYFNPWEKKSEKGHLFGVQHSEFCISAGLTYGYQVGTNKEDLPTVSHHRMSVKIPTCKKAVNNRSCIERTNAKDYKYIMMRSRTPTSAGMLGVIPGKAVIESDTWKHKQDLTWDNIIERNFAIKPQDIWDLRQRLKSSMVDILKDALAGQCTKAEFTCKDSTKKDLQKLLDAVKANS